MENPSQSSMGFLLLEEVQFLEVKDDALSQWELVNVLDAEEEAENDEDGNNFRNGFGSWDSSISWPVSPNIDLMKAFHFRLFRPDDVNLKGPHDFDDDDDRNSDRHFGDVEDMKCGFQFGDGDADEDEDEVVGDYNGYDLDDELALLSVSSKFGRQRMRKLGKREFSKMHNSKRSPYLFVRPGS